MDTQEDRSDGRSQQRITTASRFRSLRDMLTSAPATPETLQAVAAIDREATHRAVDASSNGIYSAAPSDASNSTNTTRPHGAVNSASPARLARERRRQFQPGDRRQRVQQQMERLEGSSIARLIELAVSNQARDTDAVPVPPIPPIHIRPRSDSDNETACRYPAGSGRRKRRKLDDGTADNTPVPEYPISNCIRTEPLKFRIVDCHDFVQVHDNITSPTNKTAYRAPCPQTHLLLKHQGGFPVSLSELQVKISRSDRHAPPLQGMVFCSLHEDGLVDNARARYEGYKPTTHSYSRHNRYYYDSYRPIYDESGRAYHRSPREEPHNHRDLWTDPAAVDPNARFEICKIPGFVTTTGPLTDNESREPDTSSDPARSPRPWERDHEAQVRRYYANYPPRFRSFHQDDPDMARIRARAEMARMRVNTELTQAQSMFFNEDDDEGSVSRTGSDLNDHTPLLSETEDEDEENDNASVVHNNTGAQTQSQTPRTRFPSGTAAALYGQPASAMSTANLLYDDTSHLRQRRPPLPIAAPLDTSNNYANGGTHEFLDEQNDADRMMDNRRLMMQRRLEAGFGGGHRIRESLAEPGNVNSDTRARMESIHSPGSIVPSRTTNDSSRHIIPSSNEPAVQYPDETSILGETQIPLLRPRGFSQSQATSTQTLDDQLGTSTAALRSSTASLTAFHEQFRDLQDHVASTIPISDPTPTILPSSLGSETPSAVSQSQAQPRLQLNAAGHHTVSGKRLPGLHEMLCGRAATGADHDTTGREGGNLCPHATFVVGRESDGVRIKFEPFVSTTYILVMLWSQYDKTPVTVQNIVPIGQAGPKFDVDVSYR